MKKFIFLKHLFISLFLLGFGLSGQNYHIDFNDSIALDNKIIQVMEENDMVGLATHVIKNKCYS